MKASSTIQAYFDSLQNTVNIEYELAKKCRKQGFDPTNTVDIQIAKNLAERVVGLISVVCPQIVESDVVDRIIELEKEYGSLDWRVAMQIALEIAQNKFVKFANSLEAIEIGIRVGFAYVTVGVVSSPLEGFTKIELKKRKDTQKEYFAMHFAGPVRNAGGTAAATSVIIADYVRKHLGYAKYDPDEKEQERCYTEIMDYHDRVTNLQYVPSKDESLFMCKNCPIEIDGDPSEKFEVSNHKDLPRVKANRIRSGFCLIHSSCLPLKAKKLWKQIAKWKDDMGMQDWGFLEQFLAIQKSATSKSGDSKKVEEKEEKSLEAQNVYPNYTYIADLVGGRPVISHPLRPGGLRLRYGRSRTSGFSAQSIHPASMYIMDNFIAIGTQLKVERPGKAAAYTTCDQIEGPICLLHDGSVVRINSVQDAKRLHPQVKKILYLGDVLVNFGDFFDRAHTLLRPGYCEEWWILELEKYAKEKFGENFHTELSSQTNIPIQNIEKLFSQPLITKVSPQSAVKISEVTGVPLHPAHTHFWKVLTQDDFVLFLEHAKKGYYKSEDQNEIVFPYTKDFVEVLYKLGVLHKTVSNEFIILHQNDSYIFQSLFGIQDSFLVFEKIRIDFQSSKKDVFSFLKTFSLPLRDKAGVFIGSRMGRPEKAKMRKIAGQPYHVPPQQIRIVNPQNPKDVKTEVVTEHNLKARLREKYEVHANKDGTIRYDASEVPITHFKPKEVGTSVERLRALGYTKDIHGVELEKDDQILELFPQDIVIPCCTESPFEPADEILFRVCNYIDDLLYQLYGFEPYYKIQTKKDLAGLLVFGLAPHTSAASVARIIGFTKSQGLFCHPLMHAAMRRDCDGDESCFFLLLDGFLNFSTKYLPQHRGGTMDAPLVLTSLINPAEVDDMVFNLDTAWKYPLAFYEACEQYKKPWDVKIPLFSDYLGTEKQFEGIGFTHDTSNFNDGVLCSAYKLLPSMKEKVDGQMALAEKIAAVDEHDVAQRDINKHFLRDTMGNLRKFSTQEFRCVSCNTKYRRPPLRGRCENCGSPKIIFTISKGSVIKYLELSTKLSKKYNVSEYTRQVLEVLQLRVDGVFGKEKETQTGLGDYFT
ncbi:MAG: hypothetical protein ACMXYA_01810 [Candidatus Woesearchaeota archaeon]